MCKQWATHTEHDTVSYSSYLQLTQGTNGLRFNQDTYLHYTLKQRNVVFILVSCHLIQSSDNLLSGNNRTLSLNTCSVLQHAFNLFHKHSAKVLASVLKKIIPLQLLGSRLSSFVKLGTIIPFVHDSGQIPVSNILLYIIAKMELFLVLSQ